MGFPSFGVANTNRGRGLVILKKAVSVSEQPTEANAEVGLQLTKLPLYLVVLSVVKWDTVIKQGHRGVFGGRTGEPTAYSSWIQELWQANYHIYFYEHLGS